jgi:hypothetical protein
MGVMATVKHEAKEVGLVTLYFFVCFGIILTLKKLFLEAYEIQVYALSAAVIGALVVAKVVVILDKARAGTRFDVRASLGLGALYKTLLYAAATFLALFAERLFHAYRETGALGAAVAYVWQHRHRNVIFADVICIGLALMAYHLYTGIDRRLGEGTLRAAIWRRAPAGPTAPSRAALPEEKGHGVRGR